MKKDTLYWIIPSLALVAIGALIFTQLNNQKVYAAAIIAQSGVGQNNVDELEEGLFIAVEEINENGGIAGKEIELIIADSETNPEVARERFLEIEKEYKPLFYISSLSAVSLELAELADEYEVPLMTIITTAPTVTEGHEWTYRLWPIASAETPAIEHILNETKVKDLDVIYLDDAYGQSVAETTKNEFADQVNLDFYPFNSIEEINIETHLDAEMIYVIGFQSHRIALQEMLIENGYQGMTLTTSGGASTQVVQNPIFEGMYTSAPIVYYPNHLLSNELKKKYEARGNTPFGHYGATSYEALTLMAQLLVDADVNRNDLKKELDRGFTQTGTFGQIKLNAGEKNISFELLPAQIINKEINYLKL